MKKIENKMPISTHLALKKYLTKCIQPKRVDVLRSGNCLRMFGSFLKHNPFDESQKGVYCFVWFYEEDVELFLKTGRYTAVTQKKPYKKLALSFCLTHTHGPAIVGRGWTKRR